MDEKPNVSLIVADIIRRMPDLMQDTANASQVLTGLLAPLAAWPELKFTVGNMLPLEAKMESFPPRNVLDTAEFALGMIISPLLAFRELYLTPVAPSEVDIDALNANRAEKMKAFDVARAHAVKFITDHWKQRALEKLKTD